MVIIGCLAMIVLPLLGLFAGLFIGGLKAGMWGAGIGFAIAVALSWFSGAALVKAARRR